MVGKETRSGEILTTTELDGQDNTNKSPSTHLPSISGGYFDYDNDDDNDKSTKIDAKSSGTETTKITTSNLYKHEATIIFIKEKYKNYLDWLARNYSANNQQELQQHQQQSSHNHHLAWYDFEQSLSKKQQQQQQSKQQRSAKISSNNSQQVKSGGGGMRRCESENSGGSSSDDHQALLRYSLEHLDSSAASQNHKLLAAVLNSLRNSKEFNSTSDDRRLDLDAVRRSQISESKKKLNKKQLPPRKLDPLGSRESPPMFVNNKLNNNTSGINQNINSNNKQPQQSNHRAQVITTVNPSPSRVQFMTEHQAKYPLSSNLTPAITTTTTSSSSTTGSYPSYQSSVNATPPILKPILKHAQSVAIGANSKGSKQQPSGGDYLHLVYLKRNQRKSSSSGGSTADDQASQSGASTTSSSSSSSYVDSTFTTILPNKPVLPPILPLAARCSDDFYAVLNDMEKSKFV